MWKAGLRILTRTIGAFVMVFLVFGLDIAFSQPLWSPDGAENGRRFGRSPDTGSERVVGLPGDRRYHANDSLIGQPVPCSRQEKLCFRFNMLHDKKHGCVGLDKSDASFSSGHVIPVARKQYEKICDGYVMAYDDKCHSKEKVRDICGCDKEPTRHFINGVECRCSPSEPTHVEQPKEEGRCRIPDLRFPDKDRSRFYSNPYEDVQGFTSIQDNLSVLGSPPTFSCSPPQLGCFKRGKVWKVGKGPKCRTLLEQGPCAEEHVVALDVHAARKGHVETTCVHVRGECPLGHVRMPFDNACHSEDDMKLIIKGKLFMNQFGIFVAAAENYKSLSLTPINVRRTCAVTVKGNFDKDTSELTRSAPKTQESGRLDTISSRTLPDL